ncbi:hypothetical protein [Burkholderia catarinensis]|uniref:hypothetical protein n=1 Tax=Burkholderia catarinensis TaxID=1108140 RepID=UPI001C58CD0D|nr:hypothetical protein [Burkholderia catarinensis]
MVVAALLAATAMPAFARGQPELPSDDGGRASVLSELNPTRVTGGARPQAGVVVSHRRGETDGKAATCRS